MEYSNFNYNSFFYPNYNIFNSNTNFRKIGIGTQNPQKLLDIHGNINMTNLLINGNINYKEYDLNKKNNISILNYNTNGLLKYKELKNTNSEWIEKNNHLELTLKNENNNRHLYYLSNIYNIYNNNNIYISHLSNIKLKYFYINNNISLNNININNINYKIKYNSVNNIYSFDNKNLFLNNFIFNVNTSNLHHNKIQFFGEYDYSANSLWKKNTEHNISILNNIGIFTNTPLSKLHINGNVNITQNININNITNTYDLQSNNIITNNIHIKNIEIINDKLYINSNKKTVHIGLSNQISNCLFNIKDTFIVSDDYIKSNYLQIKNNLNIHNSILNNKYSINFNNNKIIYSNNSNNLLIDTINNTTILNKLNIISDESDNINELFLDGNLFINGDLNYLNQNSSDTSGINTINDYNNIYLNINTLQPSFININSNINNNVNLISSIINIKNCILPNINKNNTILQNQNTIFFDTINNKFMLSTKNNIITQLVTNIDSLYVPGSYIIKTININHLTTNNLYTNKLDISNTFNINNSSIYINLNTLREDIIIHNNINTKKFHLSY